MRAKLLNEKFTEDSDPIADLNIGGVVLIDAYNSRRKKLEKDIEELKKDSHKKWELYLRKLLIGKTLTAEMNILPTFDTKTMESKRKGEKGKYTIKVVDLHVESLEHEYNKSIIIADEEHIIYSLSMLKKIYIK
jgi:hypothetical protein